MLSLAVLLLALQADAGCKPEACAGCHQQIYDTYRLTGMARSFSRMTPASARGQFDTTYYHPAWDQHFKMYQRDGRFFERRHQIGFDRLTMACDRLSVLEASAKATGPTFCN